MKYIVNQYSQIKIQQHKRNKIHIINSVGEHFDFNTKDVKRVSVTADLMRLAVEHIVADNDSVTTYIDNLADAAETLRVKLRAEVITISDNIGQA